MCTSLWGSYLKSKKCIIEGFIYKNGDKNRVYIYDYIDFDWLMEDKIIFVTD